MPEPGPDQNPTGQTMPAPAWWSRLHSPAESSHAETAGMAEEPDTADSPEDPTAPATEPDSTADSGPVTFPDIVPVTWPTDWSVIHPVGSIVTDVGVTFSLAPESLTDRPLMVRCTSCDWDATAPYPQAVDLVRVHALRHIADPRPRIEHLPSWLPWLKGHRR
ncbi:hypothetical protein GCM10022223_19980 [Kineosporia mesophila]|uniref:Uncharacterized protein n=1 Tax=Kineosporia mesophila TaxID=566012 RepID=A0ABP6ZCK1_9ACTN|nr:hypothetical protein [Kineosporia mesophila]MCD5350097.1 hypothetical protein [Kineosporia mesophila]